MSVPVTCKRRLYFFRTTSSSYALLLPLCGPLFDFPLQGDKINTEEVDWRRDEEKIDIRLSEKLLSKKNIFKMGKISSIS